MQNQKLYAKFETELIVRPDDIDMNNHVHNSKYFDYVLAARYDQMTRCYKMPMDEFIARGFGWVVSGCTMRFKRPMALGDVAIVKTQIKEMKLNGVDVLFEIVRKETGKMCVDGLFEYTMINLKTQRAEKITQDIIDKYSI
ncbi:MAG: acyl-CoA thioesterase [Ignavibacteriales bacterium]|nr:acyl-CoA thioesterase [Ignavibacteriales bacterium]